MPVKEKDEVLANDIRGDMEKVRADLLARGEDALFEYDFGRLCGMYRNQQQQTTFMKRIYSEIIQETLGFIARDATSSALANLCILEAVFDAQDGVVGIETGLECVETVNDFAYRVQKREMGTLAESGAASWNGLKMKRAMHVCISPFLDDSKNLALIEQELDRISQRLDSWRGEQ